MKTTYALLLSMFLGIALPAGAAPQKFLWRATAKQAKNKREIGRFKLDLKEFRKRLGRRGQAKQKAAFKMEAVLARQAEVVEVRLPIAEGKIATFSVQRVQGFIPRGLATKFPELGLYRGAMLGDPRREVRLSTSSTGLQAVLSRGGKEELQLVQRAGTEYVLVAADLARPDYACRLPEAIPRRSAPVVLKSGASDGALRSYRVAVAATHEYAAFHSGTVEDTLRAIVSTIGEVDRLYTAELGIRLRLADHLDRVIFLRRNQDPYEAAKDPADSSKVDPLKLLDINQKVLDDKLGTDAYDVGHLFNTMGAGLAEVSSVCDPKKKARGQTGLARPVGDLFVVSFVAHELGHQFGAEHTFAGNQFSCAPPNRWDETAFEPGSGSTIMGYAGICGKAEDLQPESDPYFHFASLQQIAAFTSSPAGSACASSTPQAVVAPAVRAGAGATVPRDTPFVLAAQPGSNAASFTWEQADAGVPSFRSVRPSPDRYRIFPSLDSILSGDKLFGDALPAAPALLHFAVTARRSAGQVGAFAADFTTVTIDGGSGPFAVQSPAANDSWKVGTTQTVRWEVANTDHSPVSCARVRVKLSTDGGRTFDVDLAPDVANSGAATVVVPDFPTSSARVKVEPIGNIFFAISTGDVRIER